MSSSSDQQNESQVHDDDDRSERMWAESRRHNDFNYSPTPPDERQFRENENYVKFEVPKVPVIFVLGGPGSGKVTHGDNLMQEKRGITHINMTDLLQQYAMGNEMRDFSHLSSKTVTEVLMLEMKMAPAAKTYLISGYPRSMRDVVEYAEKIQVVSGVILVAWQQKVLEKQIDYGAKIGHVVLSLAKMELNNFYKHVMPVVDYFDERGMLIAINGERNPAEVYKDFRSAVLRIIGSTEQFDSNTPEAKEESLESFIDEVEDDVIKSEEKVFPPVIWVLGGPGSNKGSLCQKAVRQAPGWAHFSVGRLLRAATDANDFNANDTFVLKQAISAGELVPQTYVLNLVEKHMNAYSEAKGILMDGFPRDMHQVNEFEAKYQQQPNAILLDCSKLQLGKGRMDDSVAAFRKRLELFRQISLPMLKILDSENRLTVVDGDTDSPEVQDEFFRLFLNYTGQINNAGGIAVNNNNPQPSKSTKYKNDDDIDEEMEYSRPTTHTIIPNGTLPTAGGLSNKLIPNGVPRTIQNGLIGGVKNLKTLPKSKPKFRNNMREDIGSNINHY